MTSQQNGITPELPSFDEVVNATKEARERGDKPIEINCLGSKNFKIGSKQTFISITIYDENGHGTKYDGIEYEDACPVCLKLMLVRAIRGSSWLACCSDECYQKYKEWKDKVFDPQFLPRTLTHKTTLKEGKA